MIAPRKFVVRRTLGGLRRRLRGHSTASHAVDAVDDNFGYNRALWNGYSQQWDDLAFRASNAEGSLDPAQYELLGEEWGELTDVDFLISDWILPYLKSDFLAAEIGSGGGRMARRVVDHVERLYCLDNSPDMLSRLKAALADKSGIETVLLTEARLPDRLTRQLDFIYAFDVFVHFDLHLLWTYAQEMARCLKPGGKALFHTSNLTAPSGWTRFASQKRFTIEGHYFVSPEIVRTLVEKAGLELLRESAVDEGNVYLARDYLCLARKPDVPG